ncbi:MAG: putative heme-binding domain-containing protein [Verrucomicrobiales bacterium]|jgi:putative heme-binding domain-containing protein
MKFIVFALLTALLSAASAQEGFKPLLNDNDLSGWDGNPDLWSVEDGVITGKTTDPAQLKYNQFLIWRGGKLKNFELRAKVKTTGNNSGVQYRSKELPDNGKWSVGGYQCDIHPNAPYNAMIYEERGRGIIVQNGQGVVADPEGKLWLTDQRDPVKVDPAEWHEYSIIARGNHIVHKIDGKMTIEFHDFDEKARALEGILAFQIHRGPAMNVQIKEVMLKTLPDGGVIEFKDFAIPSDAQVIEKKKPAPKKKPAAKPKKKAQVGPAIGGNKATPIANITKPEGFNVELIYSVPGVEQGSWVNLCNDDKGRIYASDQYGGLYRFAPPAPGKELKPDDVQKLPLDVRAVNGMLFAFDALYVGVNDYERKMESGLYRITDSNNDDELDKVEKLRGMEARGDHGVHAIVLTPDKKGLYLICGNNVDPTEAAASSPIKPLWSDDHLLPRMPDGRGHNRDRLAPGGIIYRVDPDGKNFEVFANGFRNIFDAALNQNGDLFTYDADMEYDFNTPWYRPTRINHVLSGGEYGWRNGAGKYPEFYVDNLPATLNIGPGSPTGTTFGYGAKFPAKYQNAFYALDWSWGKIYAVHLKPEGASYTATKEEFITGGPLPVTDAIIHPDGAMYFAIGGRRVQSGLYRVTYTGKESTETVNHQPTKLPLHELRKTLEAFHGKLDSNAVATVWPHLRHSDRFIRAAARTALEHQPVAEWKAKALAETNTRAQLEALLALTRVESLKKDPAVRDAILTAMLKLDYAKLTQKQRLAYARILQIVLKRFGNPDDATLARITSKLDDAYPADSFEENWLLTDLLAYLQAPGTAARAMALINAAPSQEPQMQYARSIRFLTTGWTKELRVQQLEWFLKAANYNGGSSFAKFIEFIRNDSLATFTDTEQKEHAELIAKKPEQKSAIELSGAIFAGRTPTMWKLDDLSDAAQNGMKARNFSRGRQMFAATACYACHRFGNAGGMTGPDLTGAGGRYSPHDLLDQIINPSKEINEQFAPVIVTRNNGETLTGVVVNLSGDNVTINTDLSDPNQRVNVDRKTVESIEPSKVSMMPPNLLMMLTEEEILDLVAYVLSAGDEDHAAFKN